MSRRTGSREAGDAWEQRVCEYLTRHGLDIVSRGYCCRLGELDILATDGDGLIVVEVRARRQAGFGSALETVGVRKQQRIIRATRHFLMRNPVWHSRPIRFDVIAIDGIASADPSVTWVQNAFGAY
jgi:putative endonuclease